MDNSNTINTKSLPERFFEEARRLYYNETNIFTFTAQDILLIAQDAALRREFRDLYKTGINDPDLKRLVLEFLEDIATNLDDKSKVTDIKVDLLDRAGLSVAASVTAGGVAAIISSGGSIGPACLLIGGVIGLASAGCGRTMMKLKSQRGVSAAQKINRLINTLEK